jgi:sugar phosphate isomerase/epimerase
MLLSCLPVSLYAELGDGRRSLADWFRFAGALGLDGADVSAAHLTRRSPADLAALRRQAEDAGVRIAMLATYSDFVHPSGAERRRRAEDLARWIDAGSALGVSAVRVTAGEDRSDVGEADALGWIAGGLTASAAHGRAAGLRVLYENHVRGATWARHDFTQRASRFIDVVRRTKESGLEILFDTANNLALGEDPLTVLEEVIDRVGAVHVSDIRRVGAFEPTVIGTGVSPIPAILRRLVRAGFDGWVSVEEASHTGEEGFRRGVAFADAAWTAAGGRARDKAHGAEGA